MCDIDSKEQKQCMIPCISALINNFESITRSNFYLLTPLNKAYDYQIMLGIEFNKQNNSYAR